MIGRMRRAMMTAGSRVIRSPDVMVVRMANVWIVSAWICREAVGPLCASLAVKDTLLLSKL
jgi:hypothetical protein